MTKNKLKDPANLNGWHLPKTIENKFEKVIDKHIAKIEKDLQALRWELDAGYYIKKGASEALSYAIKENADIGLCQTDNPSEISILLPLGEMEWMHAVFYVDIKKVVSEYAKDMASYAAEDDEVLKKYKKLINMFWECGEILDIELRKQINKKDN